MKNVIIRAISGAIYVAVIVAAILCGEKSFLTLTEALAIWASIEFAIITHKGENGPARCTWLDVAGTMCIALVPALAFNESLALPALFSVSGIYFLARATMALYDQGSHAYREVAKSVLGTMYIGLPLLMLNILYVSNPEGAKILLLMMFVMIWLNDTGAFCVGSLIGKHKLFPRLSPKKSWEGFWGGMAFCVICGVVCGLVFDFPEFPVAAWVALSVIVCVFSTWGDLFESMLKRTVGVKDSGSLIPGHGGILDRIDSLLFVAPATFILYFVTLILN